MSSRYVEGYQPQALNMVKTLSANEAENVFDFRYAPVGTPAEAGGTAAETAPAGTPVPAAGDAGGVPPADAGTEIPENDIPLGGDAGVNNPGGETPAGPQELVDLDEEDVPLANMVSEKPGMRLGYLPVYAGIAGAALIALAASAVYLKKRRGKAAAKAVDQAENKTSDRG